MKYRFGDLELDSSRRSLSRADAPVKLPRLSFKLLEVLVERSPSLVTYDQLIDLVWGENRVVSPENLSQRVMLLRQGLGDDAAKPRYIERVYGEGFRLIPDVLPSTRGVTVHDDTSRDNRSAASRSVGWHSVSLALDANAVPEIDLHQGPTIAVLPFDNWSQDSGSEYFSDGISEEIINALVKQTNMSIVSRTSSFQFKNQRIDSRDIGRILNATHLLEGSVRRADGKIRITAQLIDAPSGSHLWSHQYDRALEDIFELQTAIAEDITDEIKSQLSSQGEYRIQTVISARTVAAGEQINALAYDAYLQGLQHAHRLTPSEVSKAIPLFEQATTLAPTFLPAWQMLMRTQLVASSNHILIFNPAQSYRRIEQWLAEALPRFPDDPILWVMHGMVLAFYHYQWREGLAKWDWTLPRLQHNAPGLSLLGNCYWHLGEQELAIQLLEQAYDLDPSSPLTLNMLSFAYVDGGRQADSLSLVHPEGNAYYTAVTRGMMYAMLHLPAELDKTIREAKQHVQATHPMIRSFERQLALMQGNHKLAVKISDELIDNMKEEPIVLGWVRSKTRIEELFATAERQRQGNPLQWIMTALGHGRPLDDLHQRYFEKLKLKEMPERKRGYNQLLNTEEQADIHQGAETIPLLTLEAMQGRYRNGKNVVEVQLIDGRLHYNHSFWTGFLVSIAENIFVSANERDSGFEFFTNHAGDYDLCIWRNGQITHYAYRE